tara:strand:- start:1408 stop:1635 length:228 start_codon:yes stop_codon:yes gene_type:complete
MRRNKLKNLVLDGYLLENDEAKELIQEIIFGYYYDRNDMEFEIAIEEIKMDMIHYEDEENFERCAVLKHILDRFE